MNSMNFMNRMNSMNNMNSINSMNDINSITIINIINSINSTNMVRSPVVQETGLQKTCYFFDRGVLHWGRCSRLKSPSTVVASPRSIFNEIAGFETSSRPYLLKMRCPLLPRRRRSILLVLVVLCTQKNTWRYISFNILPRVEQPWNAR